MGKWGFIGIGCILAFCGATASAQSCSIANEYFVSEGVLSEAATEAEGNRAEALAFLMKAAQIEVVSIGDSRSYPFADVPFGSWYAPYVETATQMGIISWQSDISLFRPQDGLTRAEFSVLALNVFDVSPEGFTLVERGVDISAGMWYENHLHFLTHFGVILLDNGKAYPEKSVTKCEMADWTWQLLSAGGGVEVEKARKIAFGALREIMQNPTPEQIKTAHDLTITVIAQTKDEAEARDLAYVLDGAKYLATAQLAYQNGLNRQAEEMARQAWHAADGANHEMSREVKKIAHELAQKARGE